MGGRVRALDLDLELAVADDVEAVPDIAGTDDELTCRDRDGNEVGGNTFLCDNRERRDGYSPEHERQSEGHGESSPAERHRSDRSDQPADPDGCGEVTDLGTAPVEQAEDGHHDQDVQAAADESLRGGEPDQKPRL